METFSALLAICAGNSPVIGEFPTQRPVTQSFGVFFDLRRNKRLSQQYWGLWLDTPSRPLWRHCIVWLKSTGNKSQQNTTMREPCAYFSEYTVCRNWWLTEWVTLLTFLQRYTVPPTRELFLTVAPWDILNTSLSERDTKILIRKFLNT